MFFKKKRRNFKFSVVMPVYNTENYLDEAIGSIIDQTIGFKKNIQLIIVNDGSTDNSKEICIRYQKKFPQNIIYIEQTNQGVSTARNTGLQYVKGTYVNFFDSDDIWNTDAFLLAWEFFQKNEEIDVISCIQNRFEACTGLHNLSDKFEAGDRIIDIWETPQFIQLNVCAAFIKSDAAKKHAFDTTIKIGEDAKYITEIILEKEKYGVLKSAVHNVRRREAGTSITQNPDKSKFTITVDRYYKYLPELSVQKYGRIIPYIQYVMLNGLKFRLLSTAPLPLNDEEKTYYFNDIITLIQQIDDETLLKNNKILMPAKTYLLKLKYGQLPVEAFRLRGNSLYFNNLYLGNLGNGKIFVHEIQESGCKYTVTGELRIPFDGKFEIIVKDDDNSYPAIISEDSSLSRLASNGDIITPGRKFFLEVPNDKKFSDYKFEISYNGHIIPQKVRFV